MISFSFGYLIQSCLFVCCASWKIFVPAFFKVSINHLFDNLGSGKRNCCFGSKYGKSLEFWIQRSVQTLLLYAMRVTFFSARYFFPRYFPARFFPLENISLQDIFFWNRPYHDPPPPPQKSNGWPLVRGDKRTLVRMAKMWHGHLMEVATQ